LLQQYLPTLCLGIPDVITSPYLGKCFYNLKAAFEKDERELAQEYQVKSLSANCNMSKLTNIRTT
jgi:hypothetical protein